MLSGLGRLTQGVVTPAAPPAWDALQAAWHPRSLNDDEASQRTGGMSESSAARERFSLKSGCDNQDP
ncbi:uncharacterized protein STAUR_5378 [Stigmatella aurantiaca DW4/3-1]|uniref:Uncharacterized protein n=1 Tax=Stigmatella aurantiaca (strain DW4/3-1) TaxID=378806 RepID=E3FPF4_STIAD|nr:uncharacterized protein STAUR_5378 [Stigmatella aurantiaca DW4/3-1]